MHPSSVTWVSNGKRGKQETDLLSSLSSPSTTADPPLTPGWGKVCAPHQPSPSFPSSPSSPVPLSSSWQTKWDYQSRSWEALSFTPRDYWRKFPPWIYDPRGPKFRKLLSDVCKSTWYVYALHAQIATKQHNHSESKMGNNSVNLAFEVDISVFAGGSIKKIDKEKL